MKDHSRKNLAIIGGGSWATGLVKIFSEEDNVLIRWWLRSANDIEHIKKYGHNPRYLSSVQIRTDKVLPFINLHTVVKDADYIIVAVPAAYIEEVLKDQNPADWQGKTIVSAVKGMIPGLNIPLTQYLTDYFGVKEENLCVIAGPCHAEEIALEKKSYITIASENQQCAKDFANFMECRFVNTSTMNDLYGVEYCAVMKNIIALACGIARGLNYGDNFQAVILPNAMQEIERFMQAIKPLQRNLIHTAYLGDLLVTSYSQFSRNRTLGNMVGRGYSVKAAQMEMGMVAEGYFAVKSVYELNKKLKVDMPITSAVYHVMYEKISAAIEFKILEDFLS